MMFIIFLLIITFKFIVGDTTTEDIQFLNELPIDKLLKLKNSIQDFVTPEFENLTTTTPTYLEAFGAQAMAIKSPPIKRGDYEEVSHKHDHYNSKINNIFSMSVTTLAFLAFGGYLLCLIVQALKAKQAYINPVQTTPVPTTFFLNSGIKKRPQAQFASYGRRKRSNEEYRSLKQLDLPPEQLFSALLQLCEGYAKWSDHRE